MSAKNCTDVLKKKRSREAARQRRGQQNDEFSGLSGQLAPLLPGITNQLDRLCVMKLTNSFIKMKHLSQNLIEHHGEPEVKSEYSFGDIESNLVNALGGFVMVIAEDGHCLYVSPNVTQFLGLSQLEMIGDTVYKYVHPCDQPELAQQLGGQVPLEDMEIFDGLFSNDDVYVPPTKKALKEKDGTPYRSIFMRMKSTITSRGKSVNLNASIYRVVHCIGTLFPCNTTLKDSSNKSNCMLAIATPLLSQASFEVPLDRQTFTTKHSLDMKVIYCEESIKDLLGFNHDEMVGKSWYNIGHACDVDVVKLCHSEIMDKGQAVSGYYRIMNKSGGWIWLQTIGSVVYSPTNCRPLYILCINYVISGVEGESNIVSIEQSMPKMKRQADVDTCPVPSKLVCNDTMEDITPPLCSTTAGEINALIEQDRDYQDALTEFYENQPLPIVTLFANDNEDDDDYDDDLPSLEFLDGDEFVPLDKPKDEVIDNEEFLMRAPFIPPPPVDEMLTDFPLDEDFLREMTDENSMDDNILAARAPLIPPPCIDSFLTFDDFDDYDITPNNTVPTQDYNEAYMKPKIASKLTADQANHVNPYDDDMIRMVNVNSTAAVPSRLIRGNLKRQIDTSVDDMKNQSCLSVNKINGFDSGGKKLLKRTDKSLITGKSGKRIGNNGLPLITNDDAEMNCPSFDLLHGGDLFSALDQLYCPPAR